LLEHPNLVLFDFEFQLVFPLDVLLFIQLGRKVLGGFLALIDPFNPVAVLLDDLVLTYEFGFSLLKFVVK
jgi:hypothetical protein